MAADIRDTYTMGRREVLRDRDDNTVKKDLLRLRDQLAVGKWYRIQLKSPLFDDGYKFVRHKLVEKHGKYAVFESERGVRRCLSYFEIANDGAMNLDSRR